MNELLPPPQTKESADAHEVLRAWIVDGGLQCTLTPGIFGERETVIWGILLSDVARHVADALERSEGKSKAETLEAIRRSFNFELDTPTAEASGDFVKQ